MDTCQLCHLRDSTLLCPCRAAGIRVCSYCAARHFLEDSLQHYPLPYITDPSPCDLCKQCLSTSLCTCTLPVQTYCTACLNTHLSSNALSKHDIYPAAAKDFFLSKRPYKEFLERQKLINTAESLLVSNIEKVKICRNSVNSLADDIVKIVDKWRKDALETLLLAEQNLLHSIQTAFQTLQTIRFKWKFPVHTRLQQILKDCIFLCNSSLDCSDLTLFHSEIRPEVLLIPMSEMLEIGLNSDLFSPVKHVYYIVPWSQKVVVYSVPSIVPMEISMEMKGRFKSFSAWCVVTNTPKLCITGGWKHVQNKDKHYSEAHILDLTTNIVIPMLNMNTARCRHAMVSLNTGIYAIGGINSGTVRSIERVQRENEDWEVVAEMSEGKEAASVAVWRGKMYIVGYGSRKIELFDPISLHLSTFSIKFPCSYFLSPKFVYLLGVTKDQLVVFLEDRVGYIELSTGMCRCEELRMRLDRSWFSQCAPVYWGQQWFLTNLDQELWTVRGGGELEYLVRVVT